MIEFSENAADKAASMAGNIQRNKDDAKRTWARQLAESLMEKHGLSEQGWRFD